MYIFHYSAWKRETNSSMMEIICPTNIWLPPFFSASIVSVKEVSNNYRSQTYLVIWFRSIPLWICVGGKGKSEKLIRSESTNATETYGIMYVLFIQNIIYLVYLLPRTAAHLTCALQWWISPYFLHLYWLWHPDIYKKEDNFIWLTSLCQRKSADRSRVIVIRKAGDQNLDDERGKRMARAFRSQIG